MGTDHVFPKENVVCPHFPAFGTEAGGFSRTGIQSVVCGPGSITQAHIPDEYIEIDQLVECERFVGDLIRELR